MKRKTSHPLYSIWKGMIRRCYNKNFKQWQGYGGRGITVCSRWLIPKQGFDNFVADMGVRPDKYTLDRIDNDGHYSPENCRWATRRQQGRNRRCNVYITVEGEKYLAIELADAAGMKTDSIIARAAKGLSMKELLDPTVRVFTKGLALGGIANGKRQKSKTHCPRGHKYDDENTYISKEGFRRCRACRRK